MKAHTTAQLEEHWATLGLKDLAVEVKVDATIRADTLLTASSPPDAEPLPRISLASTATDRGVAGAPRITADLTLTSLLGEGGMGYVYAAQQRSLARAVAVKLARRGDAGQGTDPEAAAALTHEGRVMGELEHPNIVPVHALGVDDAGAPVLVMKRVEGVVWRDLLHDPTHPAWARLPYEHFDRTVSHLEILRQVCNAVEFAHRRGVLHRDIKPDNVMVGEFGEVYLLDWGIAIREAARARSPAQIVGTPAYMAPEMALGDPIAQGPHTDVYLLGATLHELLTGRGLHDRGTLQASLYAAVASEEPGLPHDAPRELCALCRDAVRRDPAERPGSAAEFRRRVGEYLSHRGSLALTASAGAVLAALEALPAVADAAGARDDDAAARLLECRFGYLQALREWPESADARAGLQRCVGMMIRRELARRRPDAARALLRELPEPGAELEAAVTAAEIEAREESERVARLARQAWEMDASVGARGRNLLFVTLAVIVLAFGARRAVDELTNASAGSWSRVASFRAAVMVCVLVVPLVFRRTLMQNVFARRVAAGLALSNLCLLANELRGWHTGELPRAVVGQNGFVIAAAMSVASVTAHRMFAGSAAAYFAAGAVSAIWPQFTGTAANAAAVVTALWLVAYGRLPRPVSP